jgi:SpoVK/Ycf46/Vps4 family AAA+-type ATPase
MAEKESPVFFVDLPAPPVREIIFRIHLKKRGLDPEQFDTLRLAKASEGSSGAEIEQSVVSALYLAHSKGKELSTETVLEEVALTSPLSVVMAERIAALRAWAADRTVPSD